MSRLFWKIFLLTFLAQIVATVAIGVAMQLSAPSVQNSPSSPNTQQSNVADPQFPPNPPPNAPPDFARNPPPPMGNPDDFRPPLRGQNPPPPQLNSPQIKPIPPMGLRPPYVRGDRFLNRILPFIFAILLSFVMAAIVAWYFSRPIYILRNAFKAVAAGNLTTKITPTMPKRRDELTDLAADFDVMVSQLEALLQGHKKLLHDVSHELRSPLARLQLAIGLARQQPDKSASSLERIEAEGQRMENLVDELLMLAKLEAGLIPIDKSDAFMSEILEELLANAEFEANAIGIQVRLEGDFNVTLAASAALIYRALENIVRNAIKHTAANSQIQIVTAINTVAQHIAITVIDAGTGLPSDELTRIFMPFYRSHSNQHQAQGYGLGLAIASRIVSTYGGTITAQNHENGGLAVRVVLPFNGYEQG